MATDVKAAALLAYCRERNYPEPEFEVKFHPDRQWRFDAAWWAERVALEFEGGVYGKGKPCPLCKRRPVAGHTSVERLRTDMTKYNEAALAGWRVVRVRPEEVESGAAFALLDRLFGEGKA